MKLHPYVSDKTLHHFPRSLQNLSGLLRVGDRPGLSTPAHAAGEGGGPGGWQPHVAVDALGPGGSFAGENTGCRRWPGAFCVRTTHQQSVREQLLSPWAGRAWSRGDTVGPPRPLPHLCFPSVRPSGVAGARGHDPRTYPVTVTCSLLRFVFDIKLRKVTKYSRNSVTNKVIYLTYCVEFHRNLLSQHPRTWTHAWENVAYSVNRTVHGTRSLQLGPCPLCWLRFPCPAGGDPSVPTRDSGKDEAT